MNEEVSEILDYKIIKLVKSLGKSKMGDLEMRTMIVKYVRWATHATSDCDIRLNTKIRVLLIYNLRLSLAKRR